MEYLILIVVGFIIVICGFVGRSRGLVKMALSIIATILSILISGIMTKPICEVLKNKLGLMDEMEQVVAEAFKDIDIEDIEYVNDLELPNTLKEKLIEGAQNIEIPIKEYVIESIATVALSAIVFLTIFIILSITLSIIIGMTNLIVKLPLIADANRGAGLVAGIFYGIIIVWILMIVLTALSGTSWSDEILSCIGNNKVLSYIYDSNPIVDVLARIIKEI